jgi:hypothetical protein
MKSNENLELCLSDTNLKFWCFQSYIHSCKKPISSFMPKQRGQKNEKAGPIFHISNFGHCIIGMFGNDEGNRQIQWSAGLS